MRPLLLCGLPGVPLRWAWLPTRQLPPALHVPARLWGVLPLWHSRGQHTDGGKPLTQLGFQFCCTYNLVTSAEPQHHCQPGENRRSEVDFWSSWSHLDPAVLHLLPRLPAGPGAGPVQRALDPPEQLAHPDPRWPPDAGLWPRRQPRPPGPHHHIKRQRKRQDPQETGGTSAVLNKNPQNHREEHFSDLENQHDVCFGLFNGIC